jgi:radical SAM protein with 4Fe4S-binding SPASM domain
MLKDSFCNSPWMHLRITYDGSFVPCRWFEKTTDASVVSIKNTSMNEYWNGEEMKSLRNQFTTGNSPEACKHCYYQDEHNKLSGRYKQLLKGGITKNHFENTIASSHQLKDFVYSNNTQGHTNRDITDLQVDLGSLCNSACVMCWAGASSRLHNDYQKLNKIDSSLFSYPNPRSDWIDDEEVFETWLDNLTTHNIKYLHLLGGETLFIDQFYKICERLIDRGLARKMILGTTTNGTIFNDKLKDIIPQFKQFHLGISVETFDPINDYIRYPGKIQNIKQNIINFIKLRNENKNLFVSLRITPSILSVLNMDSLFKFMVEWGVGAESCNILDNPNCLRIEYLTEDLREKAITRIEDVIVELNIKPENKLINIRGKDTIDQSISNTVYEYLEFLTTYNIPEDTATVRPITARFLNGFDKLRGNSLWQYNTDLAEYLTLHGYQK